MLRNKPRSKRTARYHSLKALGVCVQCRTPVEDGKTCCPNCREKKRIATYEPITKGCIGKCFSGGACIVPLRDVLAVLGLKVRYLDDAYQFGGTKRFTVKRTTGMTPFDALRSKGLLREEEFTRKFKVCRRGDGGGERRGGTPLPPMNVRG